MQHLETWATWMRGPDGPEGLPQRACGGLLSNFTTLDADNEKAYGRLDNWIAERVNAVVSDLAPAPKAAIYHRFLHAVYRFPRGNYVEILQSAMERIRDGLRERQVWLGE